MGHPYNVAIDMWSLGCMAAELFLGLPLFPGASEHDLLVRIVEMMGVLPGKVLQKAQHTSKYFRSDISFQTWALSFKPYTLRCRVSTLNTLVLPLSQKGPRQGDARTHDMQGCLR